MIKNFFGYKKSTFRLLNCNRLELKRIFFWFIILFVIFITAKNAWSGSLDHLNDTNWDHISIVLEDKEFQDIYNRIFELAPFLTTEEIKNYTTWFIKYAKELDLDPILPVHIAYYESKFHTEIEYDQGNGAGLMQIIFGSHRNLMYELGINSRRELFTKPEKNIQAGCRILAMSYSQYNTIRSALYSTNKFNYKKKIDQKSQEQFEKDIISKLPNFKQFENYSIVDEYEKFIALFKDPEDVKQKKVLHLVKNLL